MNYSTLNRYNIISYVAKKKLSNSVKFKLTVVKDVSSLDGDRGYNFFKHNFVNCTQEGCIYYVVRELHLLCGKMNVILPSAP